MLKKLCVCSLLCAYPRPNLLPLLIYSGTISVRSTYGNRRPHLSQMRAHTIRSESVGESTWPSSDPTEKPFYIPAKTPVFYSAMLTHRRTDLWGPDGKRACLAHASALLTELGTQRSSSTRTGSSTTACGSTSRPSRTSSTRSTRARASAWGSRCAVLPSTRCRASAY